MNFKRPFVTLGLLVLILVVFIPGFLKIRELKNRNKDLTQKNQRLDAENTMLKIELQRVEKDQVYQEKILREKMGVVRKKEVPVKIVPQD
jgi:cell division protein FtsB